MSNEEVAMYPFKFTDAGRSESLRPKQTSDCAVRSFAVVFGLAYDDAYEIFYQRGRKSGRSTMKKVWKSVLTDYGAEHIPFNAVKGQKRMTPSEFCQRYPKGRYILSLAKHLTAVIDGVVHDNFEIRSNCCVYEAWKIPEQNIGEGRHCA